MAQLNKFFFGSHTKKRSSWSLWEKSCRQKSQNNFSGKFGEIRAKIIHTPKNLLASTPMFEALRNTSKSLFCDHLPAKCAGKTATCPDPSTSTFPAQSHIPLPSPVRSSTAVHERRITTVKLCQEISPQGTKHCQKWHATCNICYCLRRTSCFLLSMQKSLVSLLYSASVGLMCKTPLAMMMCKTPLPMISTSETALAITYRSFSEALIWYVPQFLQTDHCLRPLLSTWPMLFKLFRCSAGKSHGARNFSNFGVNLVINLFVSLLFL